MNKVVTIGEILVEVMRKEINVKFNETGDFIGPFPSGAPAIFIDQVARCGSKAAIVSAVGKDGFGEINLSRLKKDGVDTYFIKELYSETTGVAFVTYKDNGDRDFIFHIVNAACGDINEDYICEELFKDCSYLHIMGSSIYNDGVRAAVLKAIDISKKNNIKISFDPNIRKEIVNNIEKKKLLLSILKVADIIISGENELFYLTDIEDEKVCVNNLLKNNASIVIVKRGVNGATLYKEGYSYDIKPYKVTEVDPTGAGDCYAGTFISCINQGIDIVKASQLSAIAGALAVTKKGPMEGNTNLEQLIAIYEQYY